MPITSPRLSQSFKYVYIRDEALDAVPDEIMTEYEIHRDFEILEKPCEECDWKGLDSLEVKPTIFSCMPLHPDDDYLGYETTIEARKEIFARHVFGAENSGIPKKAFDLSGDRPRMNREMMDEWIPTAIIDDVATVIRTKGQEGNSQLFGLLGIWLRERKRRQRKPLVNTAAAALASRARTEAKDS